jgi:hypothetical protein
MDRPRLFHGGLVLYGLASAVDGGLTAVETGVTGTTAGIVASGVLVFGAGLYGLAYPDRTSEPTDSWLAYLVAAGAVLLLVSVVAGRA